MTREDFAEWVASEIFSDDWEVNKNSFEEIACRKLVKLGIVEQIDGHYRLNKALEQEPILYKIRAEVKALPNANPSYSGYIDVVDREDVLEIIDKKEESEDK